MLFKIYVSMYASIVSYSDIIELLKYILMQIIIYYFSIMFSNIKSRLNYITTVIIYADFDNPSHTGMFSG